jgi:hypothetical protein
VNDNEPKQQQILQMAMEKEFNVIAQYDKPFITPNKKFVQCNIVGAFL